jgi:hypothetical protein
MRYWQLSTPLLHSNDKMSQVCARHNVAGTNCSGFAVRSVLGLDEKVVHLGGKTSHVQKIHGSKNSWSEPLGRIFA